MSCILELTMMSSELYKTKYIYSVIYIHVCFDEKINVKTK